MLGNWLQKTSIQFCRCTGEAPALQLDMRNSQDGFRRRFSSRDCGGGDGALESMPRRRRLVRWSSIVIFVMIVAVPIIRAMVSFQGFECVLEDPPRDNRSELASVEIGGAGMDAL